MIVDRPCYIHYSDPAVTPIYTDHGYYPLQGVHALAGLEITSFPFHNDIPFDQVDSPGWINRMARFWLSLAYTASNQNSAFQTSFELRIRNQPQSDPGICASIWVKAFAADDLQAAQAVEYWLDRMSCHLPTPCQARPVKTVQEFHRLWGSTGNAEANTQPAAADHPIQWLAEIRRTDPVRNRPDETSELPSYYSLTDWWPSFSGWREAWDLLARLPGDTWLSIGLCPTSLLPAENQVLQEWSDITEDILGGQHWSERRLSLQMQSFLLRIRLAGDFGSAQVLGQALTAALLSGSVEAEVHQRVYGLTDPRFSRKIHTAASIVWPDSILDWDRARFNWLWGDFLDWGLANTLSPNLVRLPCLSTAAEAGLFGGIWY
jgi:hypothetical protein